MSIKAQLKMRVDDEGRIAINVQSIKGMSLKAINPSDKRQLSAVVFLNSLAKSTDDYNVNALKELNVKKLENKKDVETGDSSV